MCEGKVSTPKRGWASLLEAASLLRNLANRRIPRGEYHRCSTAQLNAMCSIAFSPHGHVMVKDIAADLDITPGGASQIVENLVRSGMVRRRTSPVDRRAVRIELSPEGETRIEHIKRIYDDIEEEVNGKLSQEDIKTFLKVIRCIIAQTRQKQAPDGE